MHNQVAILIIGNEILQAVVEEKNLSYAATSLGKVGYDVAEVRIIRDDIQCIADAISALAPLYSYVISSGGVGPTHDDVTMAGIATGLGLSLAEHADMLDLLSQRYANKMNKSIRKMAMLPQTASIYTPNTHWPLIKVQNVFILPGLPPAFRSKIDLLVKHLSPHTPKGSATLFMQVHESEFAEILQEFQARFDNLDIGSYPVTDSEYQAFIRISSRDQAAVSQCFQELHTLFDSKEWVSGTSTLDKD